MRVRDSLYSGLDVSIGKEIVRLAKLAWPITLAQVGLMSLHLVDTSIVGRESVNDLAGMGVGRSIAFMTLSAGMGVPMSLEALATQAVGAGDLEGAWSALLGSLRAALVAWFPITIVSIAIVLLMRPFGVEPIVCDKAFWFVVGNAPGAYGFLVVLATKTYLQALDKTRPALISVLFANIFNYVLCSLFVRGDDALSAIGLGPWGLPKLGALGAGISASLASLLSGAMMLYAAWLSRPSNSKHVIPLSIVKLTKLAFPIGLQFLAEVSVFSVVALIAGKLGARIASAHQIAISLASTSFMMTLGVSAATAVRVGNAVGASRSPRRVGFIGVGLGIVMAIVGMTTFLGIPEYLALFFTKERDVIETTIHLLRIAAMFQLFDSTQGVLAGALRGAGDIKFPFFAMLTGYWAVGFPLALVLAFPFGLGAEGLWWGLSGGLFFVSVALFMRFAHITSRPIARV